MSNNNLFCRKKYAQMTTWLKYYNGQMRDSSQMPNALNCKKKAQKHFLKSKTHSHAHRHCNFFNAKCFFFVIVSEKTLVQGV